MSGDRIAVILDINDDPGSDVDKEEKEEDQPANPPVYWIHGTYSLWMRNFKFSVTFHKSSI